MSGAPIQRKATNEDMEEEANRDIGTPSKQRRKLPDPPVSIPESTVFADKQRNSPVITDDDFVDVNHENNIQLENLSNHRGGKNLDFV
jgi:hypothetical protein